jgi:DNA-binding NtrC family response regulator
MRDVPRVRVELPFRLDGGGQTCEGRITDLSLGGAFLELSAHSPPLSVVNLKFQPAPQGSQMEVLARVVRRNAHGMAVKFLDLDSHAGQILWSSLLPQLLQENHACPYCGRPLANRQAGQCPRCRHSLDFSKKDYLAGLLHEEDDQPEEMIGTCQPIREVFHLIRKVGPSDVSVLITGASGTGKEMVARAIHERGHRAQHPFVPINCGAIPRELLESELFGHEKGAFTGAYRTTMGTVERAHKGTLFLDEVGELPLDLQVKLLRFLQEYTFTRVGGRTPIQVDLRVIAATNSNLPEMISAGRFREDLYYRLDVVNIHLPPLKDRGDDALIMANVFLKRYAAKVDKDIRGFSQRAATAIMAHAWPGNVRELVNRIRRGVVLAESPWLTPVNLGLNAQQVKAGIILDGRGLKEAKAEFEAKLVAETLRHFQGNAHLASKSLKISRSMLYHLVHKYDLNKYRASGPGDGLADEEEAKPKTASKKHLKPVKQASSKV